MEWLLSFFTKGALDAIMGSVVQPFLNVWLKSKDVDLEKYKAAEASTEHLAVAILDANVKSAQVKSQYVLSILQWWPFRLVLWIILAICATRFCLILFDSTWWWIFGCSINGRHVVGDACSWSIPAIHGTYGAAEFEYILFFVIAKPVDTAISGALGLVSRYLEKGGR
jgi:Mn2+/Fe2+ NRAMP family transporter